MVNESFLSRILRLRPVKFKYIEPKPGLPEAGFIAQEVEELFPEAVTEKDGKKAIYYNQFGVIAVKAIQEQQDQIEELKEEVARLRETVDELTAPPSKATNAPTS